VELRTRQFGIVDIDETKIITMPKGLPGFSDLKRFIILDHDDIRPFHSLQCVDDNDLAFIIMDPFLFMTDYSVDIEPYMKEMEWGDDEAEDLYLYVIINATNPDPRHITANLIGPLLINIKRNLGVQMMVNDRKYSSKYLIFNQKENEMSK
jgi:flagellar assembly factor FliW